MLQKPFACVHIRFLLPDKFTSPDPSTLQHEAAAIHLNLSGPCEPPPRAAALQPGHTRWLLRCGAAGTNNLHLSSAQHLLKIMFSALNRGGISRESHDLDVTEQLKYLKMQTRHERLVLKFDSLSTTR